MLWFTDLTYHQKQKSYNEKHLLQNYHLKMYRKVTNRNTSFDMPPLNQSSLETLSIEASYSDFAQ